MAFSRIYHLDTRVLGHAVRRDFGSRYWLQPTIFPGQGRRGDGGGLRLGLPGIPASSRSLRCTICVWPARPVLLHRPPQCHIRESLDLIEQEYGRYRRDLMSARHYLPQRHGHRLLQRPFAIVIRPTAASATPEPWRAVADGRINAICSDHFGG